MMPGIKELSKDALVKGSFVLLLMISAYSLLNYIFQISMAKLLGAAEYGIFAVLMSIIYIFTIPSEAIQTAITKYTSIFRVHGKTGKIKDLFIRSMKKSLLLALLLFLTYCLVSIWLSSFLNISFLLLIITGLFIFIVFTTPIGRGILQGSRKFASLGWNLLIEASAKLIISVSLVIIGWSVFGALIAVLIASILAFLFVFPMIKEVLAAKREREEFNDLYHANLPLIAAMIVIAMMYSVDVIIARRVFSPEIAGQFSFVSLIGKIIIYTTSSIGKTLFPLSSEESEKGNRTNALLNKAILMTSLISVIALIIYLIFPEQIISLLSLGSTQYIPAANILFILGLAYSLIAITNVIVLNGLAAKKLRKSSYFLGIFLIIEIIMLFLFNSSLLEFSIALLSSNLLMFLYSLWLSKR